MPTQPRPALEQINASVASRYLSHNTNNRPFKSRRSARYAQLMREGRWELTPDAIAFDTNGRLTNGQHRLQGVIDSGTTQTFFVVRGLTPESFAATDGGDVREGSDVLATEGYQNTKLLSATMRWLMAYRSQRPDWTQWSGRAELDEVLALADWDGEELQYATTRATALKVQLRGLMPTSVAAFLLYVYRKEDAQRTEEFMEKLTTGVGILSPRDPAGALRNRLIDNTRAIAGRLRPSEVMVLGIRALNAYIRGEERQLLRLTRTGDIPTFAVSEEVLTFLREPITYEGVTYTGINYTGGRSTTITSGS